MNPYIGLPLALYFFGMSITLMLTARTSSIEKLASYLVFWPIWLLAVILKLIKFTLNELKEFLK